MNRGYYRTIRNNRVRLLGKTLECQNLSENQLDGQRFYFMPYADLTPTSGFSYNGLTALWGTEQYAKALAETPHLPAEEVQPCLKTLADQSDRILAPDGQLCWYFWFEIDKR